MKQQSGRIKRRPQTQRKIERCHRTLKNRILLDNDYLPGDLERQIDAFVAHYKLDCYTGYAGITCPDPENIDEVIWYEQL